MNRITEQLLEDQRTDRALSYFLLYNGGNLVSGVDLMPVLQEELGEIPPNAVLNALTRGVQARALSYTEGPVQPQGVRPQVDIIEQRTEVVPQILAVRLNAQVQ